MVKKEAEVRIDNILISHLSVSNTQQHQEKRGRRRSHFLCMAWVDGPVVAAVLTELFSLEQPKT